MGNASDTKNHTFPPLAAENDRPPSSDGFRRYECVDGRVVAADATGNDLTARIARMEVEAAQREEAAYAKGFRQGESAGRKAGLQEVSPVLERFRMSISQVEKFRKAIYHNAEQESVALALAVAAKIVGYEVSVNGEVILHTVRQALNKVVDHERIRIKLNPSDLTMLQNHLLLLNDQAQDLERIAFEADERITSGGCLIETNFGDIDAKIESQLKTVEQALRLAVDQSPQRL